MLKMLGYFTTPSTRGVVYFKFAYSCDQFPLSAKAAEYYRKAIEKSKRDEMNTGQGPLNLVMSYRRLAFNEYKDDKIKGWSILQEALKDTAVKDPVIHFYVGRFAATNDYQVKEELKHLLFFLSSKADARNWGINTYDTYYMLGKSYFLFKDKVNAKIYLQKAIDERPHYPAATQLLNSLQSFFFFSI